MSIPEAAIESAAEALAVAGVRALSGAHSLYRRGLARRAIEAAMPAIREAIAQEIEADGRAAVQWLADHRSDATDMGRLIGTEDAYKDAIRIVRGTTQREGDN